MTTMSKGRLEAFSDGVLAIIITIMVLELKIPHADNWNALKPIIPAFMSYILSFIYLGIYWNNHHHMLQATQRVNGAILWANLHLLFWLSLVPFTTGWLGENHFAPIPTALYGIVLLMSAIAYFIMQEAILAEHGNTSTLAHALGKNWKGKLSPILYALAIASTFFNHFIAQIIYVIVALMWIIPDRRIEKIMESSAKEENQ